MNQGFKERQQVKDQQFKFFLFFFNFFFIIIIIIKFYNVSASTHTFYCSFEKT